jgi:hypothetical protein
VAKRVFVATTDLVFRSKLNAAIAASGAEVAKEAFESDLAVVAVEAPGAADRIRGLVARGTPVLAFGPHVRADLLRSARDAGAVAVPNSEVERRLLALLTSR